MELMNIECTDCKISFLVKADSGEYICPECETKNIIYVFDDSIEDQQVELITRAYTEIKDILSKYNMDYIDSLKIFDLLVNKK